MGMGVKAKGHPSLTAALHRTLLCVQSSMLSPISPGTRCCSADLGVLGYHYQTRVCQEGKLSHECMLI